MDRSTIDASAFTFVMATGIVSVAAALQGLRVVSDVLFALAALAWIVLAAALAVRGERRAHPSLQSFALVAGTVVVGDRVLLYGHVDGGLALWSLAVAWWVALVVRVPRLGNASGGSLLAVVAVEALAALAASLALRASGGLLAPAIAWWVLGLALYPLVAAAIVRELRMRFRFTPDLWVLMGALAITTLAGADLLLAARGLHRLAGLQRALRDVDLATWIVASTWVVPVVALEVRARDTWRDLRGRWSFVFPLGMYSVATWTLARVVSFSPFGEIARVACFVALAAWGVVLVLSSRSLRPALDAHRRRRDCAGAG